MKTQTVSTPVVGKAMYQAMIVKADSDLDQLFLQEKESQRALAKAQQEQHTLQGRASARANQLQAAHSEVTSLQALVEAKRASVGIAEGTGAHADLLSELQGLEKKLQKATAKLQDVQASTGKEEQADSTKHGVIDATLQRESIALQRLAEKRSSIIDARDRAYIALGQEELTETMALVEVLQNHVAAKKSQLEQAQAEYEEKLFQSIGRLAEWPEHQDSIRALLPIRDSSTAVLEAAINFVGVCLAEGRGAANIDSTVFRQAGLGRFLDLFGLLTFQESDYFGVLRGSGFGASLALEERRDQLQKLLTVYRDSKRGE